MPKWRRKKAHQRKRGVQNMKKRKFSRRFKLLVQRLAIIGTILATVPMAIWTGDGTGTAFLVLIGIPMLFSKEVVW
jgi:hypothetical protein